LGQFKEEVLEGSRFQFGKNWWAFIQTLTKDQVKISVSSLKEMLEVQSLDGKSFLDIGCGSGLFSLAAKNLNANVHSFDFDTDSVKCTLLLKKKFHPNSDWSIEEGSVLDDKYITSLGKFDVVYSWGVLHHTGNLFSALDNACIPVKIGGKLFMAIYNDQGVKSKFWLKIKNVYNSSWLGKMVIIGFFFPYYLISGLIVDILKFKNPFKRYKEYKLRRGMSMVHDWYDWLGGLPFEVASPEVIFEYYKSRGFQLDKLVTTNTLGCNQFVFKKVGYQN